MHRDCTILILSCFALINVLQCCFCCKCYLMVQYINSSMIGEGLLSVACCNVAFVVNANGTLCIGIVLS